MKAKFTKHEKRLTKRLNREHRQIYINLCQKLEDFFLDFIATNIKYFTSHGKKHSEGIIRQISNMVPDEILDEFSSQELFLLLSSIRLHDIGLLVNRDPETGMEITDKEIREKHHKLSEHIVLKYHRELGILSPNLADLIAKIILCHRKNEKIDECFGKEPIVIGNEIIRPRFLAALLRFGDAMDTDYRRAPELIMNKVVSFPDDSYIHWIACKMIEIGYQHADKKIYVVGTSKIKTKENIPPKLIKDIFYWKLNELCEEFFSIQQIFTEFHLEYRQIIGLLSPNNYPLTTESVNGLTLAIEKYNSDHKKDEPIEIKDVQIISLEYERLIYNSDGDNIFYADVCKRMADFYNENSNQQGTRNSEYLKKSADYYSKAEEHIDLYKKNSEKCFNFGLYYLRFLKQYFSFKKMEQRYKSAKLELKPSEKLFLEHGDMISKALDYLEQEAAIGVSYDYLTDQFRTGRSPSRKKLRKALDDHYQTINYYKNKEYGSVHKGCCLCTAELISEFLLSQEMNKFQRNIQPCIDSTGTYGRLFLSLSRYINCIEHVEDIEKLFDEQSIVRFFLKKLLNNKDNLQHSEKYKILPFLLIWKRTKILPKEFEPEQLKREASIIADSISKDFMWSDGSWAHNSKETLYRIRALLFFWEYFLSDETTTIDEYYNIVSSQSSNSSDPKQKEDI